MKKIVKNLYILIFFFLLVIIYNIQKINQYYLEKITPTINITKKNNQILSSTSTLIPTQIPSPTPVFYSVIKVVDGDTVDVNINGKTQRIRVIGINTPEVVDLRKTVECFGKEASKKAKELLEGKKVRLEQDPTQGNIDKYGRLLRYIFLEDNTDFGLIMIKEGYAYEYTYNIPYKYQQQYKQAQIEAQENKKGLWADGVCLDK